MTVPLCSSLGVPDEDNARGESRKSPESIANVLRVTYCVFIMECLVTMMLVTGIRKSKEPCDQLEGVHATRRMQPDFGFASQPEPFPLLRLLS